MKQIPLIDLANVIRSKNAGPFLLTLDVFFCDETFYWYAHNSGKLSKKNIAELYQVDEDQIVSVHFFKQALGWKATLIRPVSSGSFGDSDVYGAQQHAPLLEYRI